MPDENEEGIVCTNERVKKLVEIWQKGEVYCETLVLNLRE